MAKKEQELTYREKLGHSRYDDPGLDCSKDEVITVQSAKDECDINLIVQKYTLQDVLNASNNVMASYGDFSDVPDFQTALIRVQEATEAFSHLPVNVKKRFDNNPQLLFDFVNDDNNYDEAVKLGLVDDKRPKILEKTVPAPSVTGGDKPST